MISLTIRYYEPVYAENMQCYDLRVVAVAATDMPKEVFVFQRKVTSSTDAEANGIGDQFVSLADPVDLEAYPVGAPDLLNNMPYYRTDEVTLRFRCMEDMHSAKTLLDADIRHLIKSLKAVPEAVMLEVTYV